jgi:quercetin dioxygenase-like cupin family protein
MTPRIITLEVALTAAIVSSTLGGCTKVSAGVSQPVQSRVAFSHALPSSNGDLRADVVEVTYAPGASSHAHSHACPVIGYVLDGAIRTQSGNAPAATYVAGETFYETPNTLHRVSSNASMTRRARFLAYFICGGNTGDEHRDAPARAPRYLQRAL